MLSQLYLCFWDLFNTKAAATLTPVLATSVNIVEFKHFTTNEPAQSH